MTWWVWVVSGLALLGLEILTPGGFVVFFFGCAAIVTGVLAALGILGAPWTEWLLFSVGAIVSLLLFRGPMLRRLEDAGPAEPGSLIGDVAILVDDLPPGGVGKAELRGTSWTVRADTATPLPRGTRCRVERVDGLILWVRTEGGAA